MVVADCDVVLVLFQYGIEMVEDLRIVAVVFAEHLVFAFVAGSGFPVEFLVEFRMVGLKRLAKVIQEGVDGFYRALKVVANLRQHLAEFLRFLI